MSIPFTVDVSAFYGSPDPTEQSSNTIIDRRKTLNLHKKIENANNVVTKKTRKTRKNKKASQGGAIGFKETGGAVGFSNCKAGALAFNETQLMNELSGLKKGGALPALAAAVIPTLVEMAPQIISAIKSMKKDSSGGAMKIGGASAVFLDGVDPSKYDEMIRTLKAIDRQRKNLIKEGGAIKVGSGKMGTFFKNAWNTMKTWYGNNADKLKPITDILVNSAVNSANKYIDKGVDYVANKTGSDTVKQIGNIVGNMGKDTVNTLASRVSNYGAKPAVSGSGYDIDNLTDTAPQNTVVSKKKKILTAFPNNERQIVASVVKRGVYS